MWYYPKTLEDLETALDSGKLFVAMNNGAWWQARRNGATRRWVRAPARYRIPIKYGFRGYDAITEASIQHYYRVAECREDAQSEQTEAYANA